MFCKHCGAVVFPNVDVCNACGNRLNEEVAELHTEVEAPTCQLSNEDMSPPTENLGTQQPSSVIGTDAPTDPLQQGPYIPVQTPPSSSQAPPIAIPSDPNTYASPAQPSDETPGKTLGLTSMILGICALSVGVLCSCTCPCFGGILPFAAAIAGLIVGLIGADKSKTAGIQNSQAKTGIILSIIAMAIIALFFIFTFVLNGILNTAILDEITTEIYPDFYYDFYSDFGSYTS